MFGGNDFSALDALFSHARFRALRRVLVRLGFPLYVDGGGAVDLGSFQTEGAEYVRVSFSEMS